MCAVCEFWVEDKTQNLWCVAMGCAALFFYRSVLLLYSTGSGLNRVKVVCLDLVLDYYVLSCRKKIK